MTRIRKFAIGLALATALVGAGAGAAQADHHSSSYPGGGTLSAVR
ncbi:hypothetical protein RM844_18260 [Streptomyces sp. DSM 44915]|uniref:Uncharacterized protein n=1 Tax=Streptomyces chisholmiae TaxID=3075540 RepID=A0ABU2JTB2_9ACTN|nr:hypothetical protein [Streptomyces sp. DSM 44915]MDT0268231.1 hypothetical protein [Streptomyces sp. DSM 44915]